MTAKRATKPRRAQKRPAKDGTSRGRKPLLDERIIEKLEKAYELGASMKDAAGYAGIHHGTLIEYLNRADKEGEDPLYAELADRLERARAKGNVEDLEAIRRHGRKSPKAVRVLLSRLAIRDPDHYSEKRRIELTGKDGGPIQIYLPAEEGDGAGAVGAAVGAQRRGG